MNNALEFLQIIDVIKLMARLHSYSRSLTHYATCSKAVTWPKSVIGKHAELQQHMLHLHKPDGNEFSYQLRQS